MRTPKELEDLAREFIATCPREDVVGYLPYAQISVLHAVADTNGQSLAQKLRMTDRTDLIRKKRPGKSHSDTYSACFVALTTGYFAAQYLYTRRFTPFSVDFELLKHALADFNKRSIKPFLPVHLDYFLSLILPNTEEIIAAQEVIARHAKTKVQKEYLSHAILRMVTYGATLWQVADSLSAVRPAARLNSLRLFLSYSHQDRSRIKRFDEMLRLRGFDTWLDERDIPVGAPVLDRIRDGLTSEVQYQLIFLSKHSVRSEWVRTELRLGYQREVESRNTFVLPILLSDCTVPAELKIKKYLNARRRVAKCVNEIVNGILWHERMRRSPS